MIKVKVYELTYESKRETIQNGESQGSEFFECKFVTHNIQDLIETIESITSNGERITRLYTWEEDLYTEEEMEEVRAKLENAWGFVDNIREHLDELESDLDNVRYSLDEAKDDCDSAIYELDQ